MPPRTKRPIAAGVSAPGFEEVADELYGLPEKEFTATRTRYEKQAKQAGDAALAARIHALAKPTVTAWVANQLARQHHDELQPLRELGAGLQQATRELDGDQLRKLSRQQHELVSALVQQGRQLARAAGRSITEETARGLEDTLRAALADEHAAELLLAGRLTQPLHSDGFPHTLDPGSVALTTAPRTPRAVVAAPSDRRAEERQQADHDLTDAERAVVEGERARAEAQAELKHAEQAAAETDTQIEDLRRRLDELLHTQKQDERHRSSQASTLQRTERALSHAQRRQADARARRDRVFRDT
jgi:hypothetical protein